MRQCPSCPAPYMFSFVQTPMWDRTLVNCFDPTNGCHRYASLCLLLYRHPLRGSPNEDVGRSCMCCINPRPLLPIGPDYVANSIGMLPPDERSGAR